MKRFSLWCRIGGGIALAAGVAVLVQPQPPRGDRRGSSVEAAVSRLMSLDENGDGKLTKSEVSDPRLQALFQRADADQDGIVTKEELAAQLTKDAAAVRGGGGPGGPGGPPDDRGPGGPPGPGGRGPAGPQPGQVLPAFLQDELNLSEAQRKDLLELQKDVDARLARILTEDQQQQLRQMRGRGPGGPGRGGPNGPGGQGGNPPGSGRPGGRPPRE